MKTRKEFSKMNKGKRNTQNVIILPPINHGEVESLVEYSLKYDKNTDFEILHRNLHHGPANRLP